MAYSLQAFLKKRHDLNILKECWLPHLYVTYGKKHVSQQKGKFRKLNTILRSYECLTHQQKKSRIFTKGYSMKDGGRNSQEFFKLSPWNMNKIET